MIIHFEYTPKDFQQAVKVQTNFFVGKKSNAATRLRRMMLGWIVFAILLIVLLLLILHRNALRMPVPAPLPGPSSEVPTQNFLLSLIWSAIPPLFVLALFTWSLAKPAALGRVPLYTPPMGSIRRWRVVLKSVAAIAFATEIAAIVAFARLPTTPDWHPADLPLFATWFAPWIGWLIAWSFISRIWKKCVLAKQFHEESSARLPQELEATESHILMRNKHVSKEFKWTYFASYLESEEHVLLFTRDVEMVLIPKRAFLERDTLVAFFSMIQDRVSVGRFLPRTSAFPALPAAPLPVLPVHESKTE